LDADQPVKEKSAATYIYKSTGENSSLFSRPAKNGPILVAQDAGLDIPVGQGVEGYVSKGFKVRLLDAW